MSGFIHWVTLPLNEATIGGHHDLPGEHYPCVAYDLRLFFFAVDP